MKFKIWLRGLYLFVFTATMISCSTFSTGLSETIAPTTSPTARETATVTVMPTLTFTQTPAAFNGERAFRDVEKQVAFGPRLPNSQPHAQAVEWIKQELDTAGWLVEMHKTTYQDQPIQNIIGKLGEGKSPWIIIGAHYDSRMKADRDPIPENRETPVPAANDGASGVAVLLELARVLPKNLDKQVWLLFIDAEDQGSLPGWDWILGSRAFAETLTTNPDSVVIIDMIGDASLNIPKEMSSSPDLVNEIWEIAAQRGHHQFLNQNGYSMLDDHTPFLQKGIRAIDIIDFDYTYWHTIQDTPDKVSPESLYAVGDTLLHWLTGKK